MYENIFKFSILTQMLEAWTFTPGSEDSATWGSHDLNVNQVGNKKGLSHFPHSTDVAFISEQT